MCERNDPKSNQVRCVRVSVVCLFVVSVFLFVCVCLLCVRVCALGGTLDGWNKDIAVISVQ